MLRGNRGWECWGRWRRVGEHAGDEFVGGRSAVLPCRPWRRRRRLAARGGKRGGGEIGGEECSKEGDSVFHARAELGAVMVAAEEGLYIGANGGSPVVDISPRRGIFSQ